MLVKYIVITLSLLASTFAVSGINFNGLIKKNHVWEARFFSIILILGLSYLVASFVLMILSLSII